MDPTPDPTPFFGDFKDAIFSYCFLITYPQVHYLQTLKPKRGQNGLKKPKTYIINVS
jgi:hypothetical protein